MQTCQSHRVLVQHARFNLQAESLLSRRQMDAIVCVDHLPNKHQPFLSQFDLNESYEISDQMIVPKVADTRKNGALGETWVTSTRATRSSTKCLTQYLLHYFEMFASFRRGFAQNTYFPHVNMFKR